MASILMAHSLLNRPGSNGTFGAAYFQRAPIGSGLLRCSYPIENVSRPEETNPSINCFKTGIGSSLFGNRRFRLFWTSFSALTTNTHLALGHNSNSLSLKSMADESHTTTGPQKSA